MAFRDTLVKICSGVPGALGASVMGYDGIAVDSHELDPSQVPGASEDVPVSSAVVEYANIFSQFKNAAQQLQAGDPGELTIRTEKLVAVGRAVSEDYFVVVVLTPDANAGKARYLLRLGAGQLRAEL